MIKSFRWVLILCCLCLSACQGSEEPPALPPAVQTVQTVSSMPAQPQGLQQLQQARKLWQSAQVQQYRFLYKAGGGYKFQAYPFQLIEVYEHRVQAVNGQQPLAQTPEYAGLTIEQLFQKLETHLQNPLNPPDSLQVNYDVLLGFPTDILYSPSSCCDQDYSIMIHQLQVLH